LARLKAANARRALFFCAFVVCRGEWKGAIAQPGLSEYSFGAAGEEIFLRPSDHKPLVERRAQHAARA
jgi:hypothetical protein